MPTTAPARRGDYLLVSVKGGAESPLWHRQEQIVPMLTRAAWRRGVVTFKIPPGFDPPDDFFPDFYFAQAVVRSLGQVTGSEIDATATAAVTVAGRGPWDALHVWQRDPKTADPVDEVARSMRERIDLMSRSPEEPTRPGDLVLDCLIDAPGRWWIGWHRAGVPTSCLPGGIHPVSITEGKVSRAWLKLDEAIATSGITLEPGQRACELGAAPGGACQRLLESGLHVVGVDPAVVDPRIANQPRFEQWRMRARDVQLKAFRGFDWFVTDMNIDPKSTMESLGRILTAARVRPRGVIATLKLPDWSRATEIPGWLDAFAAWRQRPVMVRQLSTGGREICVVARAD